MIIEEILIWIIVIVGGFGMGSCATSVYTRIPNGELLRGKWGGLRAHCDKCFIKLRTRDLFPVFNWLITGGKCFNCGTPVNPIYFIIELGTVIVSVTSYAALGIGNIEYYLIAFGLGTLLIILSAQNYSFAIVPDKMLLALLALGLFMRAPQELLEMIWTFIIALFAAYLLIKIRVLNNISLMAFLATASIWFTLKEFIIFLSISMAFLAILILFNKLRLTEKPLSPIVSFSLSWYVLVLFYLS